MQEKALMASSWTILIVWLLAMGALVYGTFHFIFQVW
jgi:hypothetical protein